MGSEIRLNAFTMNCVGHQSPGLWTHPRDRTAEYTSLRYWTDLAQVLEAGLFDGVFLADVLGVYDVYAGNADAALRRATQVPANDPVLVIPAMAAVTRHLGFGVTVNLSYEPPFAFARRMSTLDHLTEGRIGWNVVTGYLDSAARANGRPVQTAHDARYDVADDYMAAVYKLWEGSWADDAVVRDRVTGVFARPERVRAVHHAGPLHPLDAIHLAEPSPQRTPVLYQAGSSPRGRAFAARHAECVFVSGPSVQVVAPRVAAIRALAAAEGRKIRVFALLTAILGETDAAARAKLAGYRAHVSHEGALALMSGWAGVDLSGLGLDERIRHVENDAGRSAMENITRADPSRSWTVRDVAEHVGIGGIGPVLVGTPGRVADEMEAWIDAAGVDGFNLASVVAHETFADVGALLVPELQGRGRYKRAYAPGTLREKLFGAGPRLPAVHPAAASRAWTDDLIADTIGFVRTRSRPWIDSGQDRAADDVYTIAAVGDLQVRLHAADALLQRAGRIIDAVTDDETADAVAAASIAVAEAKILTTEVALLAANKLFELAGTRATLAEHGLDRHWRNARVHTLHDPVRWKFHAIGNHALNGINPPIHAWI